MVVEQQQLQQKLGQEPAPANDVISSNKDEAYEAARQVIANDPTLSTVNENGDPMTQEQVDEWINQMDDKLQKTQLQ